jgi:hypothetical protein
MNNYGALRTIAGLLKFLGWATIVIGGFSLIVMLIAAASSPYTSPYTSSAGVTIITILVGISIAISGMILIASGEFIDAIIDIAINTSMIRKNTNSLESIAINSEKTVNFFDRVGAKGNQIQPVRENNS